MRQGLAAVVVCAVACLAPAGAAGDPAPTSSAPIVVAGVPVTVAQARARAGRDAPAFEVRDTLVALVQARIVAGEAALRGVSADPDGEVLVVRAERRFSPVRTGQDRRSAECAARRPPGVSCPTR